MQLPTRQAVDPATTWDLTAIYKTPAAFVTDQKRLSELTRDFVRLYQGRLTQVPVVVDALADYQNLLTIMDHLSHYAFLPVAADTTDAKLLAQADHIDQLLAQVDGQLSFLPSELMTQSNDLLNQVAEAVPDAAPFIRHLKAQKAHALDPAAEKLLAELAPALSTPDAVRSRGIMTDLDYGHFTVDGKDYPLTFVSYEETYQKHPDTAIRRAAYAQFTKTLRTAQNTMATAYLAQVQKEKALATARGFDSVVDYLLADQEVTRAAFNRQIDVIMTELAPVMRRYVTHIKQLWGLDKITYTDLQIDLDPTYHPSVALADAEAMVQAATAPLGQAYQARMKRAFAERWVDFPSNLGKESGAFATMPYGQHPFVLMSWADNLPSMYTLIHELGHTGQMSLSDEAHGILAHEMSLYLVESPSTFNELLLTHSLLTQAEDDRMKRFALSRLLSDTYFHNCVTHLLEAAFQRQVYQWVDAGESFDAARLNALKHQVLSDFWGDAVDLTGAELTWMRQAHYYMGLYSYTYSNGLTVATAAYQQLKADPETTAPKWLAFLASGDAKPPVAAAAELGIDLSTDQPLRAMIAFLDQTEQEIEALSAKLA